MAAALCLGAAGVWTGTLWLASRESDVDMIIKERLIASSAEDTDLEVDLHDDARAQVPMDHRVEEARGPRPATGAPIRCSSARRIQGANDNRRGDLAAGGWPARA
ncbi:MAG: nitronate monooxygenase [bacterium]